MQETSCCKFELSIKMYNSMTTSNLYSNNDENNDGDEFVFVNS